jgi:hypothetical protein
VDHPNAVIAPQDSSDWISCVLDAGVALRDRGCRQVYLILDDHAPVAPCNSDVLNALLPGYMSSLGARVIHLMGWGQVWGRSRVSRVLGPEWSNLGERDMQHRIGNCLHPSLWDLQQLCAVLAAQHAVLAPEHRTAWSFEFCTPDVPGLDLSRSSYLVHGSSLAHPLEAAFWSAARVSALAGRLLLRSLGLRAMLATYEMEVLGFRRYYHGPYPLLWSGAMESGQPSLKYQHFLRRAGRGEMLEDLRRSLDRLS